MTTAKREYDVCGAVCNEPPGYWHTHRCGKRAKFVARDGVPVCGIHNNEDKRREDLGLNSAYRDTR